MELSELTNKILELFECKKVDQLSKKIMKCVISNDDETKTKFVELVKNNLSVDWLQAIYQYHLADRKVKKQDYTPKTLAKLMAGLTLAKDRHIVDMCAGSGALTIQAWNLDKSVKAQCLEFDENVIPFLLFNLSVRNIESIVKHMDVLENETFNVYKITRSEKFGKVEKIQ